MIPGVHVEDGYPRPFSVSKGSITLSSAVRQVDAVEQAAPANSLSELCAENSGPHDFVEEVRALPPMEQDLRGVLQDVQRGCQVIVGKCHAKGSEGSLLSLGAFQLGLMRPGDELDLVYVLPTGLTPSKLRDRLGAHFETQSNVAVITEEGDLAAPGLTFSVRGVGVRLFLAQRVPGLPPPVPGMVARNTAALYAREALESAKSIVPNSANFRFLSRFIRSWARQHGIYGTYLGFFGGPAWTVCCARVCQMYPDADIAQLPQLFFHTLRVWDWSQPFSILSDVHGREELAKANDQQVTVMDVLLPIGDGISAAPYVSETTSNIMAQELLRAFSLMNQAELARAHGPNFTYQKQDPNFAPSVPGWPGLGSKPSFFKSFRYYLQLEFMASNEEVMHKWFKWGKKCMSQLVRVFEDVGRTPVLMRPWPEVFVCSSADWPHSWSIFVGMKVQRTQQSKPEGRQRIFDLREPITRLLESITAWPHADQYKDEFELCIKPVLQRDVEQWLHKHASGDMANAEFPRELLC